VAEEIASENIELEIGQVRAICGAMMFSGDDAKKKISILSGGEQGRVLLGKVLAHKNNVLLLDEPSNHLDMESIDVMIKEIKKFPGTIMIVTHNEKMLRTLATKLIVFNRQGAEVYNGTYDEFLRDCGWEEEGEIKRKRKGNSKKGERKERAKIMGQRSKHLKPLKKEQISLEKIIQVSELKISELNDRVMETLGKEGKEIQELYQKIGQLQIKVEKSYSSLEAVLAAIDKLESEFKM